VARPSPVGTRHPRRLNARLVMVGIALTLAWVGVGYRLVVVQGTRAEEYAARGGNSSLSHVDFMIGSRQMDIDGILPDGSREALMRSGEWAF